MQGVCSVLSCFVLSLSRHLGSREAPVNRSTRRSLRGLARCSYRLVYHFIIRSLYGEILLRGILLSARSSPEFQLILIVHNCNIILIVHSYTYICCIEILSITVFTALG